MTTKRLSSNPRGLVLWESPSRDPIAARIAVAGDFLPAGALGFPADLGWAGIACNIAPQFEDVDLSFANLEAPLDTEGLRARRLTGIGTIVSAPSASLDYLAAIHCRAVGIANNHSFDFGAAGLARTREAISRRGMTALGAGPPLKDAAEIFVWEGPGGLRVGFWAAAKSASDFASRKKAGIEPATIHRARWAFARMKSEGAHFCIALLHAGCLRTSRPDPEDVRLMDSLALCGFQLVAASHSHRISGGKRIGTPQGDPRFCFYGLGSVVSGFIADSLEREGLVVVANLSCRGELLRIEARPVSLDDTGFGVLPSPEVSRTILSRFEQLSSEIADGSYEQLFYQDVSQGLVQLYLRDAGRAFREDGFRGLARKAGRVRVRHVRRLVHKVIG